MESLSVIELEIRVLLLSILKGKGNLDEYSSSKRFLRIASLIEF